MMMELSHYETIFLKSSPLSQKRAEERGNGLKTSTSDKIHNKRTAANMMLTMLFAHFPEIDPHGPKTGHKRVPTE